LSVDYILRDGDAAPLFIDCNPRLVEPMSAYLAGADLVALLLRISLGEVPVAISEGRAGVRTHLAMQALLGCAVQGGTRRDILRQCRRVSFGMAPFAESAEELTPVGLDWVSALPLAMLAMTLVARPNSAATIASRGFGAHLLDPASIRLIEDENFADGVPDIAV
jgi:hypothetical protein